MPLYLDEGQHALAAQQVCRASVCWPFLSFHAPLALRSRVEPSGKAGAALSQHDPLFAVVLANLFSPFLGHSSPSFDSQSL